MQVPPTTPSLTYTFVTFLLLVQWHANACRNPDKHVKKMINLLTIYPSFPESISPTNFEVCFYVLQRTKPLQKHCSRTENQFSGKLPTFSNHHNGSIFLIHGYKRSHKRVMPLAKKLVRYGNYYAVVVGWSGGASTGYKQAAANTKRAAAIIAQVINKTITKEYYSRIHIIGRSLGAHIAGFIGKLLQRTKHIGRISGVDPAKPAFENNDKSLRLDYSDATFVDVVHTDADFLGIAIPIGHVDFYPDGGRDLSICPDNVVGIGADFISKLIAGEKVSRAFTCDHSKSLDIYGHSVPKSPDYKSYVGYSCGSWAQYEDGYCDHHCTEHDARCNKFGFEAKKPQDGVRRKYYFYLDSSHAHKQTWFEASYLVIMCICVGLRHMFSL